MLMALLADIEALAPVRLLVTTSGVYPLISALHILGIALLVGSISVVDLRLLQFLGPQLDAALPTLVRMAIGGFMIAVIAGMLLMSVRVTNYAFNPAFQLKLVLLLAAGTNALLLRGKLRRDHLLRAVGTLSGTLAAAVSLVLWVGAVVAGRWIAFV
jgi:hypothetical protein